MAITIKHIMDQAQVYASAWSLVGGPFDQGNQLQQAEDEKQALQELLVAFEDEAHTSGAQEAQLDLAKPLIEWHQNRIQNINKMLEAEKGTELCIGADDPAPLVLNGSLLVGWRTALSLAKAQFEKFPLSLQRSTPAGEEEE